MIPLFDTIADGLAEHGYAVADQFLSQTEVGTILSHESFQPDTQAFKKAGIGKQQDHQINEGIRGDYIRWIDKRAASEGVSVYLMRIEQLMQYINRSLYLSLKDYEIHMTVYPVGSFYRRHLDQFKKDDHRKLSVICYLNEGWTEEHGGQLRIYRTNGPLDILPVAGRLVCFRSDKLEHEVLPATRERLSLTGWILDQYADAKHL
jgi:SM-20-related protein